jgi:hypothetical protein
VSANAALWEPTWADLEAASGHGLG